MQNNTSQASLRPLICVLNRGVDIPQLELAFPKFEWCVVEDDFFGTLNAIPRIPTLFFSFLDKPKTGEAEMRGLPIFILARSYDLKNMEDLERKLPIFQEMVCANMRGSVYYRVTDSTPTISRIATCAYNISPKRFLEMHTSDRLVDDIPHFWVDLSSSDASIRKFVGTFLPSIQKYSVLANTYHTTTFQPITFEQLKNLSDNALQTSTLLPFAVFVFFFKEKKATNTPFFFAHFFLIKQIIGHDTSTTPPIFQDSQIACKSKWRTQIDISDGASKCT